MARLRIRGALALIISLVLGGGAGTAAGADPGLYHRPVLVVDPGVHTAPLGQLDTDRAGRFLVTASDDKTVRVWAAEDGKLVRTIRLPAGPGSVGKAGAVAISPDGATIAASGWTGTLWRGMSVYLFDRASGQLLRRISGPPTPVVHLAFSPDGTRLAAMLDSNWGVQLIDPASGRVTAANEAYDDGSYGAAFDPASGRLATTSRDGKVHLHDRDDLRLLRAIEAPGGRQPYGIAFSPDGTRLAARGRLRRHDCGGCARWDELGTPVRGRHRRHRQRQPLEGRVVGGR